MLTMWKEFIRGNLLVTTGRSLLVLAEALAFDGVLSILLVFLCQKSVTFCSLYGVIATIMNSIPNMALLPLIIMWLGTDNSAIPALVTHSVIWTFTIYINDGIIAISKIYVDIADNLELHTVQKLKYIYFPAILPDIISEFKISWKGVAFIDRRRDSVWRYRLKWGDWDTILTLIDYMEICQKYWPG